MNTILAIDQGTTGTKALIMNEKLQKVAECTIGFKQIYPKPGWVEHNPEEIWRTVIKCVRAVVKKVPAKKIVAIGITNQRETVCFWDRKTGKPLANAMVWQDRRTADECTNLKQKGMEPYFQDATGLLLDPYFSGTKVAWALKHWDVVKRAHSKGTLAVGTIDSYLLARFADGGIHFTEPSNASRTLCYHLTNHRWDSQACQSLGVPMEIWPEVRPSVGTFTKTQNFPGLPDGIPITGILGDQQSALLGQACIEEGTAKCTYGTGAFLLMNTGHRPIKSRHRLLTTIAWALNSNDYTYALEGSAFIAGAAVQWVRDGLKLVKKSSEIEKLARSVSSSDGVVFVPSLTGLGAPYWDPHATGMITGLTRGTGPGQIARATLEGIAYQNADLLIAMQKDLGKTLESLNVDGGACSNNLLMQIQSDILGCKLQRPRYVETTSLGAVFAAGLGIGIWKSLDEVKKSWKQEKTFEPKTSQKERESLMKHWHGAIARVVHHHP
jgi:glycerol kinase